MKVEQFLEQLPEAFKEANASAARIRSALDNWLVTLSVAMLAWPSLVGSDKPVPHICMWVALVVGHIFLIVCVILTLARAEVGLERIFLNVSIQADMVARIRDQGYKPGTDAALEALYRAAYDRSTKYKTAAWWLSKLALACFILGVLLVGGVALARAYPHETSANNRLKLSAGGGLAADWRPRSPAAA